MRSLIPFILLFVIGLSFIASPGYSNDKDGRYYYTYIISYSSYFDGEPVFNDTVVFKLVSINETAYRVVPIKYNESNEVGHVFKVVYQLLLNETGGIVSTNMFGSGIIRLTILITSVFWLPKDLLKKAVKAADIIYRDKDKLCKPYRDLELCEDMCAEEYSGNQSAIAMCKGECWERHIQTHEYDMLYPLQLVLTGSLSPDWLSEIICGHVEDLEVKSISAKQVSDFYIFELETINKFIDVNVSTVVITIYSSSGWLIQYKSKEISKIKTTGDKESEDTSIYTIKLIDTNDDNLKTSTESILGIGSNNGLSIVFRLGAETIIVLLGVASITAIVVAIIKRLLRNK